MSPQLQAIINEAQQLSTREQMKLISVISKSLENKSKQVTVNNNFWKSKTIEQLINEQRIKVADNVSDFWPEDESADEFNDFIYEQRREDLLSE